MPSRYAICLKVVEIGLRLFSPQIPHFRCSLTLATDWTLYRKYQHFFYKAYVVLPYLLKVCLTIGRKKTELGTGLAANMLA